MSEKIAMRPHPTNFVYPVGMSKEMKHGETYTFVWRVHQPTLIMRVSILRHPRINKRFWRQWWTVDNWIAGTEVVLASPVGCELFDQRSLVAYRPIFLPTGESNHLSVTYHGKTPRTLLVTMIMRVRSDNVT